MNKKSIIIIVIIAVLILGVWLIKTFQKEEINMAENTNTEVNEDFKLKINKDIDLEKLKSYNLPIIIDFGADYCMPCRQMAPALREINEEMQEKAIVRYVDVERYPKIAEKYKIELIPTQILFNSDGTPFAPENAEERGLEFVKNENGDIIYTVHIGALTKAQMKAMLKEMGLNE
ncbi:MAG: thioredoxin [Clostridia bacterium]|nr:thioredoxin [Clostridia bacterium]